MTLRLPPTLLFCSLNPQIPQSSLWEKNGRLQILVTEVATWGPRVLLPLQGPQEWENACWPGQQTWKALGHLLASTPVAPGELGRDVPFSLQELPATCRKGAARVKQGRVPSQA